MSQEISIYLVAFESSKVGTGAAKMIQAASEVNSPHTARKIRGRQADIRASSSEKCS